MQANTKIFERANDAITDDIKKELRLQGHHNTGELEASFVEKIIEQNGRISLTATAAEYLERLERGVPASQIQLSKQEFNDLVIWVMQRGLARYGEDAVFVASAIVNKWRKEGMPTEGSKQFSQTGERTHAVRTTFEQNDKRYAGMIDDAIVPEFDKELTQIKSGVI